MAGSGGIQNGLSSRKNGLIDTSDSVGTLKSVIADASSLVEREAGYTRFPHLDTFDHGLLSTGRNGISESILLAEFRPDDVFDLDSAAVSWLQRYGDFILGLIGEDTCHFSCSIRAKPKLSWKGYVRASQHTLKALRGDLQLPKTLSDFAFEYVASNDHRPADGSSSTFTLQIIDYEGVLRFYALYNRSELCAEAAPYILESLAAYVLPKQTRQSATLSQLNYPPRAAYPAKAERLLYTEFLAQAKAQPSREAIRFLEQEGQLQVLTYNELHSKAVEISRYITETLQSHNTHGSRHQHIVPVYLSSSPELYTSYLAILLAGHAFCPLPVDAPADRLEGIITDIKSSIVLSNIEQPTSGPWAESPTLEAVRWINVSHISRAPKENHRERRLVSPGDLAYVMYTSGTTGRPKGVQITHSSAWYSITSHIEANPLPLNARWFQFAAPTFDPSIMEIFVTLSSGATLCSAPREMTLTDPESVISKLEASHMMATPSIASLIRPSRVPTLRGMWTMGEALTRKVIEDFSGLQLTNAYGPTEASINCTMVSSVPQIQRGSIIGEPLSSCSMFIIDPYNIEADILPMGFAGELAIGGPQVSVGYLDRPEANDKAFISHLEYGRLYRTGDKARIVWYPGGQATLDFLGRLGDEQVKINGQRVELGEIDSTIGSISEISEVATILQKSQHDSHGGEVLTACVVPRLTTFDRQTILSACHAAVQLKLPAYMHPTHYVVLDSLPRTSSAKLDRRALRREVKKSLELQHKKRINGHSPQCTKLSYAQNSELEIALNDILESVKTSKASDPSSRLYLDSLTSMRALQRFRDRGFEELTLKDLLHAESVSQLAQTIRKRRDSVPKRRLNGIASSTEFNRDVSAFAKKWTSFCREQLELVEETVQVLPATATQSRILLSFTSGDTSSASGRYVNQSIFRLTDTVDVDRLRRSWNTVIARYDIFRTQFVPVDDDLSPFAQCTSSSQLQDFWNHIECDRFEDVVNNCRLLINLKRPYDISLVQSSGSKVLILSLFHAIFDYGSLQMLLHDVNAEYYSTQAPQRTNLQSVVMDHFSNTNDESDDFWADYLEGAPPTVFPQLTGVRPELLKQRFQVTKFSSQVTIQQLQSRCQSMECSPLSVIQAAWSAILLAYTGSQTEEVLFDSLFANRLDAATENCIAPTFVTVPTRVNTTEVSTAEVLRKLTIHNATARERMHTRLRSTHRNKATLDTILALQIFPTEESEINLFSEGEFLPMSHDYAVMMEVWLEGSGSLIFKATYNDHHLDDCGANLMNQQLAEAVQWVLCDLDRPFSEIVGSGTKDLRSISNQNSDPFLEHRNNFPFIHSQFEYNVHKNPEKEALLFVNSIEDVANNLVWTYQELDTRANAFAKRLLDIMGPLNGAIIPLSMEKRPELYVAVLGIVKAGGAWCPIDMASPPSRRRELIARIESKLLIVAQESEVDVEGIPQGVNVLNILGLTPQTGEEILPTPHSLTSPSNPAYLIWTSGTTGLPKGVPVSHSSATTSMKALQNCIPSSSSKYGVPRCTQFSQHTFDVFVQDLFYTWGLGGTVISANKDILVGAFPELVAVTDATHAHLTPAFGAGVERSSCPSLEVITMIGEKLPQHVADDWGENMSAYNTYGPAEATVVSTLNKFGGFSERVKSANIGLPLPSLSCYVVRGDTVVMTHGIGELALGGHQLASGYYKNPDKTSEKFKWNEQAGETVYLTGDIVRQLANGTIEFVGREDDLVKLGGIRVELSEISFALRDCHSQARQIETFHMSRPDRASKLVVCFIAIGDSSEKATEVVNAALQQGRRSLPDFMVPGVVIPVEKIPKTPSAKVDRKVLQSIFEAFDINNWESEPSTLKNLSEDEYRILDVVSGLSGVPIDQMKTSSYLPSLGIDSLNAGRLAARLRSAGISAKISDILKSRTIANLLAYTTSSESDLNIIRFDVGKFNNDWQQPLAAVIGIAEAFTAVPASPLQDGLVGESFTNFKAYWSNHLYKLAPGVEIQRLRAAWQEVADSNEMLRTGFFSVASIPLERRPGQCNSTFLQIVRSRWEINWADGWMYGDDIHESASKRFAVIAQSHAEGLFINPPWAVTTIQAADSTYLMLTIHHALHDAVSLDYIIHDVSLSYNKQLSLQKPRPQVTECMAFILEPNFEFWVEMLAPFALEEELAWPDLTGKPEHLIDKTNPKLITAEIPMDLSEHEIQEFSRTVGISPATLFRSALGVILADYLESQQIVFGEVLSQRIHHPNLEHAIAPLVATAPIPFKKEGTVRKLLTEQEKLLSSIRTHQLPSGATVREALKKPMSQSLYPAIFVYHTNEDMTEKTFAELEPVKDEIGLTVEHPFAVNLYHTNGWKLELSAHDTFMTMEHLKIIASQIEALVNAMIKQVDASLEGILDLASPRVISVAESSVPWPDSHPCTRFPTYWLEYHAKEHPEWYAAEAATTISEGATKTEKWTYKTLSCESNKIASLIHELGFNGQVIAMCAGRTLRSYACIAGILKSGSTYLPIDDRLPQDRKKFLLQDSGSAVIFTDSECTPLVPGDLQNCRVINMDEREAQGLAEIPQIDPASSSYLLYTSGSTGKPKGVLVSHQSLCGFVEGLSSRFYEGSSYTYSKGGSGKWLGLASRAFDVHLGEMFLAWKLGLTAVTAPRETLLDDLRLALTELQVTHSIFVPSLLEQAGIDRSQIPDVVFMAIGGEKLTRHIIDNWSGHEGLTVVNAYGPTELAIGCTASIITPSSTVRDIGPPYSNSQAHVLLPGTFNYAKRGQSGELCFTGCLVGNGYLNRPDAKGFVDNFRGQRMYRTGDMVRMMANDHLDYLGRSDDQTKIRGQRIELAEVSETIRAASDCPIDVATLVLTHPSISSSQLISFVADQADRSERYGAQPRDEGQEARANELQNLCRERLPKYMVPDHVIIVSILPLAPISGKVDAKVVKAFFTSLPLSRLLGSTKELEPRRKLTETEVLVKDAILRVTKADESELVHNANLLGLGFDSLSIVGLVIQLRKAGFFLSVASILADPTIEAIASRKENNVKTQTELTRPSAKTSVDVENADTVLPCLPLQESLVAMTLHSEQTKSYVNHMIFEFHEHVNENQLTMSWEKLVHATSILRTSFHFAEDNILQVIHKPTNLDDHWSTLAFVDAEHARDYLRSSFPSVAEDIAMRMSNISPWRVHFASVENGSQLLLLSIHHGLYDGNSLDMMFSDLYWLYNDQRVERRTAYESLLREESTIDEQARKKFWTGYLAEANPCRVSCAEADNLVENSLTIPLSSEYRKVQETARLLKVTPASLLQTIFAAVMARVSGSADFVFGAILSGRSVPVEGAETICAPCLATIPQRVSFNSDVSTLNGIAGRIQEDYAQCVQYQHTPLRSINRWVNAERPLFDCLYSFNQVSKSPAWYKFMSNSESSMNLDYAFAVEFAADLEKDSLLANCTFTSAFGSEYEARDVIERMDILIAAICRNETIKVTDLGIANVQHRNKASNQTWSEDEWTKEESIAKSVVAQVAALEETAVSKNISFLRLGIDSISAIRLASNLRKAGLKVSSSDIMRYTCIGELCANLCDHPNEKSTLTAKLNLPSISSFPTLSAEDTILEVYPCTPLQTGMITGTLVSEGRLYKHTHTVLFDDRVDALRLKSAWLKVVNILDILRTSFHYGNSWVATVHSKSDPIWTDANQVELADVEGNLRLETELDFTKPPVEAGIKLVPEGLLFFVTMHHALYDGNSVPMLFDILQQMYEGNSEVEVTPFSTVARLVAQTEQASLDFWTSQLTGYTAPERNETYTTKDVQAIDKTFRISQSTAEGACKSLGVTLQTISLVAFGKALSCFLGQRDVVFGHVVSGRSLALDGVDDIIGPLFNTVPLRIRFENAAQSNQEVLSQVQGLNAQSQPHQHAPLQHVQNSWRQRQPDGPARLFDALFLFQKRPTSDSQSKRLWLPYEWDSGISGSDYGLNFEVEHRDDGLSLSATGSSDYINASHLTQLLENTMEALEDIINQPSRSALGFSKTFSSLPLSPKLSAGPAATVDIGEADKHIATVRKVLSESSGVSEDNIEPDTNIFAIGLDSIAAIKVAALCRKSGLSISVAEVLQGGTLAGICKAASKSALKGSLHPKLKDTIAYSDLPIQPIDEDAVESVIPCVSGQTYHLVSWLQSGKTLGEPTWAFRTGKLDLSHLQNAWRKLKQRHSILRTTFVKRSATDAVQVVLKADRHNDYSVTTLESDTDLETIKQLVSQEQRKTSDLSSPPVRMLLIQGAAEDVLLLTVNHAMYDAWSLPILMSDLSKLYNSVELLQPPSFIDCVNYMRKNHGSEDEKNYWQQALRGFSATILGKNATSRSDKLLPSQDFVWARDALMNVPTLQKIVRKYNLTLPNIILLAFSRLLARNTGVANPVFGLYQTGRSFSFSGIEDVAGPCLNMTPMLVQEPLRDDHVTAATELQHDLQKRATFEQSALPEILRYIGADGQVLFNTYINLLWHHDKMAVSGESIFEPMKIGLPTEFAAKAPKNIASTVDGLEWPLAKEGLYIDVSLSSDGETVSFGARMEANLLDLQELKLFLVGVAEETESIINRIV